VGGKGKVQLGRSGTPNTGRPSAEDAHPPDETLDESPIEGSPLAVGPPDYEGSSVWPPDESPCEPFKR